MESVNPVDAVNAVEAAMTGARSRDKKPKRRSPQHRSPKSLQSGNSLQFCTVSHPDQFREPSRLRENRKHVMRDWLIKKSLTPSSKDAHAQQTTTTKGRRTKRPRYSSPATDPNQWHNQMGFYSAPIAKLSAPRDFAISSASSVITDTTNASTADNSATHNDPPSPADTNVGDDRQLVPGISGRYRDPRFHNTTLDKLTFLNRRLGSALNEFNVWPGFDSRKLDIARLKLNCKYPDVCAWSAAILIVPSPQAIAI